MRYVVNTVRIIIIAYIILFCVFNISSYEVVLFQNILFIPKISFELPAFIPIVAALILGAFLVIVVYYVGDKFHSMREIKQVKKQLEEANAELSRLRSLPLKDSEPKGDS